MSKKRNTKTALLTLASVAAMASCDKAEKGSDKETSAKVEVAAAEVPVNKQVETKEWVRVTIDLTPEQQAQLKKQGVDTRQLKIVTYDISQLAGDMIN